MNANSKVNKIGSGAKIKPYNCQFDLNAQFISMIPIEPITISFRNEYAQRAHQHFLHLHLAWFLKQFAFATIHYHFFNVIPWGGLIFFSYSLTSCKVLTELHQMPKNSVFVA